MSESSRPTRHRNAPLELQIRNRGLRDYGFSGLSVIALIALVGTAVGFSSNWMYGLAASAILTAVSWRLWAPVLFEFGPLGVAQKAPGRRPRRIAWNEMGRVEFLERGLLITVDPSRPLPSLRSVYIRYCGNRQRLERLVSTYVRPRRPHVVETRSDESTSDFSVDDSAWTIQRGRFSVDD